MSTEEGAGGSRTDQRKERNPQTRTVQEIQEAGQVPLRELMVRPLRPLPAGGLGPGTRNPSVKFSGHRIAWVQGLDFGPVGQAEG